MNSRNQLRSRVGFMKNVTSSAIPDRGPRRHRFVSILFVLFVAANCVSSSNRQVYSRLFLEVQPSDMDAEVYVDGNYIGQVAEVQGRASGTVGALRLAPGVHRLEIRKPGYFPMQRTLNVRDKPAPETSVEVELLRDHR